MAIEDRRKPLPYSANKLVDDAIMALSGAQRSIMAALQQNVPLEERFRLNAMAIIDIKAAETALNEAKRANY